MELDPLLTRISLQLPCALSVSRGLYNMVVITEVWSYFHFDVGRSSSHPVAHSS